MRKWSVIISDGDPVIVVFLDATQDWDKIASLMLKNVE